jgi:hypothetical protein
MVSKHASINRLFFTSLVVAILSFGVCTIVSAETIMGRFISVYDSNTSSATTVLAGYCEDDPVVIGPSISKISNEKFTSCTKDDIDDNFLEKDITLKRVTKFANNGKEIVADVVIDRCKR